MQVDLSKNSPRKKKLRQIKTLQQQKRRQKVKIKGLNSMIKTLSKETFASTVHFYSPRDYLQLRKILQLPHPSSIREWTLTINCEPGFFTEVFSDFQKRSSNFQRLHRMLPTIHGMAIKKRMIYDKINCKYAGFIDYGNLSVENEEEYASKALVFMLTGLKTYWKCPIF